ncbi:Fe-S cluster assembly protein SufD [Arundinibacter roseus]|uniref:Fe-S cluster assembly protein SufD n=1 Tax=Arundinibacter roseus TaxID=2070510 RepID=A0A4R4KFC3_9BACT|nr:Fe-S cluster assembly protein SufD [Arundinibacter roseus]TDB65199.1 Fe-S cluster assembly protein SufD [Arundinibacter roseus]
MSTETIDLKSQLIADFNSREKAINGKAQTSFHQAKRKALHTFETLGFPTPRNEEWKYSNVKNLISQTYDFEAAHAITADLLNDVRIPNLSGNVLFFINGKYEAGLSTIVSPAEQLTILPLQEAVETQAEVFEAHFGTLADATTEAFTALNTAFAGEGLFLHVPAGAVVEQPVILHFINDTRQQNVGTQPRNLFIIEKNAELLITETFMTVGDAHSFTNSVTEIHMAPEARVQYYKVQNESDQAYHVGTTQVRVSDNGHFYAATVSLNGGFIRNNLNIALDGEHCEAFMYGLYFPDGKQHIDNHTIADHRKPNSQSNELYKGVLRGKSTGVFNGKIFVREDAQKTNAFQSCKNVVLSTEATMNTKPQLEIFADDVKCSHGTTTGQLDEEALFYMRSRGISKPEALSLLMFAFCEDVISQIKIESIREYLEGIILKKLS